MNQELEDLLTMVHHHQTFAVSSPAFCYSHSQIFLLNLCPGQSQRFYCGYVRTDVAPVLQANLRLPTRQSVPPQAPRVSLTCPTEIRGGGSLHIDGCLMLTDIGRGGRKPCACCLGTRNRVSLKGPTLPPARGCFCASPGAEGGLPLFLDR